MNKPSKQTDALQGIEYSVHTTAMPEDGQKSGGREEKQGVFTDLDEAGREAETFLKTGKYQTVEIKQKYFDKKKNREVEVSLKTLEKKVKVKREIGVVTITIIAVLCGLIAFGITYFLSNG